MIFPNYVPDWCGKRAPAGYEEFRTALAEYRAAIDEFQQTENAVLEQLRQSCRPDLGKLADPWEVGVITDTLRAVSRPQLDRVANARNRMKSALKRAFAGDPQAPAVGVDIDSLRTVVEAYGRGIMLLEETAKLWAVCNSEETWEVASDALQGDTIEFVNNGTQSMLITGDIQMAFQATQDACKTVRVRGEIPDKRMKKAGDPKTTSTGGAALAYPKSLDVGKKPKKLPVNVKSTNSGYGTVTVTRGSKGIVATGGWFEPGTSGLLMTVPGKSKEGKVTLTFAVEGGPTVKAKVKLI